MPQLTLEQGQTYFDNSDNIDLKNFYNNPDNVTLKYSLVSEYGEIILKKTIN